jgi:hypothetical protein
MRDAPERIDVLITPFGNMSMCSDGSPLWGDAADRHVEYVRADLSGAEAMRRAAAEVVAGPWAYETFNSTINGETVKVKGETEFMRKNSLLRIIDDLKSRILALPLPAPEAPRAGTHLIAEGTHLSVRGILVEFAKGCSHGPAGECEECLAGAVSAIAALQAAPRVADPDCECCYGDGLQADGETPCPCVFNPPAAQPKEGE